MNRLWWSLWLLLLLIGFPASVPGFVFIAYLAYADRLR
jgi:hypothetical protein